MGQFTERYEKEQTWAVLPSEPFEPENGAERLDVLGTASPADLGGGASIAVPLPPEREPTADGDTD